MIRLLALLLIVACAALSFYLLRQRQKKREAALLAEMENQKKALRMLGNAAIAMESGNKEESKQFIDEANALLKKK